MNGPKINIDLIGKYLAGEASPEEAMLIDHWRFGSPEASKDFNQIAAVWYKINNEAVYSPTESADAWKAFRQNFIIPKEQTKTRKLFPRIAVAASVLLIAAISIAAFFIIKNKKIIADNEENIVITKDSTQLKLPDNSVVTLNKGSSFKYNKSTFNSRREINFQGNATFNVTHINGIPFTVNTSGIGIKVVGTIFNVSNDNNKVSVSVRRGTVLVYHQKDTLVVKAGNTAVFSKQTKQLAFVKNETAIVSATLVFHDAPMSEVKTDLENTYHVKVVFDNDLLNQCRISTQFQNKPLKYVLDIIATSLGIQYKQENNTVYFYGHACN